MATKIETLQNKSGDVILPRTKASAVTLDDGSSVEYALANRTTDDVKLQGTTATSVGVAPGTTLSTLLTTVLSTSTNNVLASAELVD